MPQEPSSGKRTDERLQRSGHDSGGLDNGSFVPREKGSPLTIAQLPRWLLRRTDGRGRMV